MLELLRSAKTYVKDALESRYWSDRPNQVNFEITAACDARCIHCPRLEMDRPMKAMKMDLFRRMVDQAAQMGVPYLCPNGYGEICTIPMPALTEYFDYISSSGFPFKIVINTNGNRMFEDRCDLFIRHRVHLINVTIDGATAETAESIRINLNFDQIEENIKTLLAKRNAAGLTHPKVRVGMVAMPQTIPEIDRFMARWNGIADFVGIGGFSSRLTSVGGPSQAQELVQLEISPPESRNGPTAAAPKADEKPKAALCVLPFRDMDIWADGKAVLCCEDWNEEYVVGDLNTETLRDIWLGPKLAEVRRLHLAKRGHEVSLCGKCNAWQPPSSGTRLWS